MGSITSEVPLHGIIATLDAISVLGGPERSLVKTCERGTHLPQLWRQNDDIGPGL